jgi:hypothetical protein
MLKQSLNKQPKNHGGEENRFDRPAEEILRI